MKKIILLFMFMVGSILSFAQGNTKFKSVSQSEFATLVADKNVQVIDVRTADEFAGGHIERAENMDVKSSDFDKKMQTLDKKKTVAVYCRSGARSKVAAQKLAEKGYIVIELEGGILVWKGRLVK